MKVFISYASQNKATAEMICDYLEKQSKKCWIAPRDIPAGKEYGEEIIKGIEQSNVFVLLYSFYSNQSQHVLREVERAVSKNIPIISYNLDDTVLSKSLEYFLLATQRLDAAKNNMTTITLLNDCIDKLLSDNSLPLTSNSSYDNGLSKQSSWFSRNKLYVLLSLLTVGLLMAILLLYTGKLPALNNQTPTPSDRLVINDNTGTSSVNESLANSNYQTTKPPTSNSSSSTTIASTPDSTDSVESPFTTDNATPSANTPITNGISSDSNTPIPNGTASDTNTSTPISAASTTNTTIEAAANISTPDSTASTLNTPTPNNTSSAKMPNSSPLITDEVSDGKPSKSNTVTVRGQDNRILSLLKEGDYIKFGRYYPSAYKEEHKDGEILWVVTDINKAHGNITLVSQYIIDILPFDTAESGDFDTDHKGNNYDRNIKDSYSFQQMIEFRGNSSWERSNIRTWLNSKEANVSYLDSPPKDKGTDEFSNGYHTKSGFLHNFTDFELSMLQENEIKTTVNALNQADVTNQDNSTDYITLLNGNFTNISEVSKATYQTTRDKVFLLSLDEVIRYKNKNIFQPFTKFTASAAASDQSSWTRVYASEDRPNYIWATRTPVSNTSHLVVTISNGNSSHDFHTFYAAASGFGIRPAIVINLKDCSLTGLGKSNNPYELKEE